MTNTYARTHARYSHAYRTLCHLCHRKPADKAKHPVTQLFRAPPKDRHAPKTCQKTARPPRPTPNTTTRHPRMDQTRTKHPTQPPASPASPHQHLQPLRSTHPHWPHRTHHSNAHHSRPNHHHQPRNHPRHPRPRTTRLPNRNHRHRTTPQRTARTTSPRCHRRPTPHLPLHSPRLHPNTQPTPKGHHK